MEFLKKKKKILYAGCVFFVIMFLCTLLSKGIYGASLPQVETEKPEKRALGHMVEAEGMVTANREVAVDTVSGLKVNQIYVNLGDSVSANTLLFDVDQEDLKEKISEQELAIKKLEMSNEQARQQKELDAQKELLAQNATHKDWCCTEELMKTTRDGKALYLHCLPADINDVSCVDGEVEAGVFDRYRTPLYREASFKPYIIAAMILMSQVKDPVSCLRALDGANDSRKRF